MALDPQHSLARDSDHLATAERIHHGQHGEGCDACALAAEVARLIEQRDVLELDRVRLAVEVHRLREGLERIEVFVDEISVDVSEERMTKAQALREIAFVARDLLASVPAEP